MSIMALWCSALRAKEEPFFSTSATPCGRSAQVIVEEKETLLIDGKRTQTKNKHPTQTKTTKQQSHKAGQHQEHPINESSVLCTDVRRVTRW